MRAVLLPSMRRPLAAAGMAAGIVLVAFAFAVFTQDQPMLALAVPAVLGTAALCARWPATGVIAMVFLSAAYGSLQAFGGFSTGPVVDLLLAALWVSVMIGYAINGRDRPWWIWPGVAILFLYIGITFLEIATAESVGIGLKSFRFTTWYMLAVPLLALAGWQLGTYLRISRALIGVVLLVAGYAVLRLLIGAAPSEEQQALEAAGKFNAIGGGELSLIGSFPNRHGLAFWATCAVPLCLAAVLLDRRMLWRVAAAAGIGLCLVAAYATDVRAVIPALVAGAATVIVLNHLSAGGSTALAQTIGAVAIAILAASVLFVVVAGPDSGRYGAILSPSGDVSYEQRIYKWEAALEEMEGEPFGNGLGTAGRIAESRTGAYVTAASYSIDSSYLKIAFEQGFPLLAIFVAAMIAILVGLARRAIRTRSPGVRALAIGAAGTLVAALVLFAMGKYIEDVSALIVWIPVGAAIGAIGAERAAANRTDSDEEQA